MSRTLLKWSSGNIKWGNNPYTWGDVALVEEIRRKGSGIVETWEKEDKEKYKKFIKLTCKVKGYNEEKFIKEIKDKKIYISIDDIKLVVNEVTKSLKII